MTTINRGKTGQAEPQQPAANQAEPAKTDAQAGKLTETQLDRVTGGKTGGKTHSFGDGGGTAFP